MTRRILPTAAVLATYALVLAGCAGTAESAPEDDDRVTVVASTSAWGSVVEAIGGDTVEVVSLVTSAAQDPHSYEATAADQLEVSRGDLLVLNGGGYDGYMEALIEGAGTDAPVIRAVESSHDFPGDDHDHDHGDEDHDHGDEEHSDDEHSHEDEEHSDDEHSDEESHSEDDHAHEEDEHAHDEDEHGHDDHEGHDHIEGFNEHVWYDPHTVEHVAEQIADELSVLLPDEASVFESNLTDFQGEIATLEEALEQIAAEHGGEQIAVTEPVPLYLTDAAGLVNVTPEAFTEAVEEGQDVAPAVLLETRTLVESGDVRVVIANTQTGGPETDQIIAAAEGANVPVLEFAETLPDGSTYIEWMTDNIDALAAALAE